MSENLTRQPPEDPLRLILARLDSIDARMTALEERVDRRLQETRPIWEAVLARLDKLEERMTALERRMDNLELDMRAGFRRVERIMSEAAQNLLEVRGYQNDLEKRMDRLEESKR